MDSMNQVMSLFLLGAGIYIFYEYFKMVKTGHISEALLLGPDTPESRCKDKEAYLKKGKLAVLILAIVTTGYGLLDFINNFVVKILDGGIWFILIYLIVLCGYFVYTGRLKKQYIRPY